MILKKILERFRKKEECISTQENGAKEADKGVPVGYFAKTDGESDWIYFKNESKPHAVTFGGTGDGKTTNQAIAAAVFTKGSLIIPDSLGEITACTIHHRQKLGYAAVANPYEVYTNGLQGIPFLRWNPTSLDYVDPKSPFYFSRLQRNWQSIVPLESQREPHWDLSAQGCGHLINEIIIDIGIKGTVNLPFIAHIISDYDIRDWLRNARPKVRDARIAARMTEWIHKGAEDIKSQNEVFQNLRRHVKFLNDPALKYMLSGDDCPFERCKQEVCTYSLLIPLEVQDISAKLNNLFAGTAMGRLYRQDIGGSGATTLLLDEAHQFRGLGETIFPNAYAAARKFKVGIWSIWNDYSQLVNTTNKHIAETILNNCGLIQVMSARDLEGSEYWSKKLGEREVVTMSKSINEPIEGGGRQRPTVNISYGQHPRKLMLPHEIAQDLGRNEELLWLAGVQKPIRCFRASYLDVPEWKAMTRPNPYYEVNNGTEGRGTTEKAGAEATQPVRETDGAGEPGQENGPGLDWSDLVGRDGQGQLGWDEGPLNEKYPD